MSVKVPTVRQIAWISLIPHLMVLGLFVGIWYLLLPQEEEHMILAYGAISYLLLSNILRSTIPKSHRLGIVKVRRQDFLEALPFFEKSYAFFKKYDWLDKYRFLLILTSSAMTYKEMALLNQAFCYGQIGEGKRAKEIYEKILTKFPENGMAITALRQITAIENAETK